MFAAHRDRADEIDNIFLKDPPPCKECVLQVTQCNTCRNQNFYDRKLKKKCKNGICHNLFDDFLWQNNWRIVLWLAPLPLPPIRQHHNHNLAPDLQISFYFTSPPPPPTTPPPQPLTWSSNIFYFTSPPIAPLSSPPTTTPQPQPLTRSSNTF